MYEKIKTHPYWKVNERTQSVDSHKFLSEIVNNTPANLKTWIGCFYITHAAIKEFSCIHVYICDAVGSGHVPYTNIVYMLVYFNFIQHGTMWCLYPRRAKIESNGRLTYIRWWEYIWSAWQPHSWQSWYVPCIYECYLLQKSVYVVVIGERVVLMVIVMVMVAVVIVMMVMVVVAVRGDGDGNGARFAGGLWAVSWWIVMWSRYKCV